MKKEKKSHLNLWIYVVITVCILSSSIAYSALNASVKITGDVVIEKPKNILYEKIKESAVMDNIKSTYVSSSIGINFEEISSDTNGKGVYERAGTENQQYPIYYYRGAVDNNNVIFAKYCWKIVRTTETGGVKLIFNGTPSSSNACNNTGTSSQLTTSTFNYSGNSLAYVGYKYGTVYPITQEDSLSGGMYGSSVSYSGGTYTLQNTSNTLDKTHHYSCGGGTSCSSVRFYMGNLLDSYYYYITLSGGKEIEDALVEMLDQNQTDSNIKTYIENTWYKNNMTNYSDKLEDTVWCYDRGIYKEGSWDDRGNLNDGLEFEVHNRLTWGSPSLECLREQDKFTVENGRLQYKTGLLTVDEAMLAGIGFEENKSYYLYTGQQYWLGTPGSSDYDTVWLYAVGVNGAFGSVHMGDLYSDTGVRPAVSLKAGINYNGGDGTTGSPYIID